MSIEVSRRWKARAAGDKGDTSNIAVIAYDAKDYPLLERHVTAERVKEHFSEIVRGEVVRYALPNLGALNFVLRGALGGGVTRSLASTPTASVLAPRSWTWSFH